jgi:C4-dicarboxylate transporter DctM subunit
MTDLQIGFAAFAAILVLVALRMPIGVALALAAIVGLYFVAGPTVTMSLSGSLPYEFAANWELSAVPTFLLMGAIVYRSGLSEPLFHALSIWLRPLPGGLAIASNFACAIFAAACGSSVATTVAMGRIAIPEMLKVRYDAGLATAVCACAGTLGSMIPPSVMMIIYCAFTGQSVAALFIAGVVPGLLTAAVYAAMILTRVMINPALAPPRPEISRRTEKIEVARRAWGLPVLVVLVIGSIYGGVATPTEAGAFGSLCTMILARLTGKFNAAILWESMVEALRSTATIFFVALGAVLLTRLVVLSGVPDYLTGMLAGTKTGLLMLLAGIAVTYLILGCFLEPISIMLLTLPIIVPALTELRVNLIWFGILIVKLLEIGLITPPVGLNVFAAKTVGGDQISLGQIFGGCSWFLFCELIILVLLVAFPQISLFLPQTVGLMKYQ